MTWADRILLLMALALAVLFAAAAPREASAADATATAARVGGDAHRTRFVADLDKSVGFTAYTLPDPYRVIIDMPDVSFTLPSGSGAKGRGLVTAYRFGQVDDGHSRIVMDTKGPVRIEKSFVVDPQAGQPARIVVDLLPTTEAAFLKSYKKDQHSQTVTPQPEQQAASVPDDEPVEIPAAKAEAAPQPKDGKKVIVLDPGHGGIDPGAIGVTKLREKDVVLAYAQVLKDTLEKTGHYTVVMTRSDDTFIRLEDRVQIARDNHADLLIALHADLVRGASTRGATIYTLSAKASDAEAEALAQKENRADIIGGMDLATENKDVTDILIDLAQRESKAHALLFAKRAFGEMRGVTSFTGKPTRSAGFVVLKAPDVPSVLVELGYLSSKQDSALLTSDAWRRSVAAAMTRAVDNYFATEVAQRTN
ncbi:N-acetylmuramoyl-L-alanine amidase [Aestuariivirga sp.]|uniref:N-acetylmuramoyl-L-alanine amidase n=1 Tax=Aestuariivirga sp. TaxID=2650926 RepID=UPI0039E7000D